MEKAAGHERDQATLSRADTEPEIGKAMFGIALAIGVAGWKRYATRMGRRARRSDQNPPALHCAGATALRSRGPFATMARY